MWLLRNTPSSSLRLPSTPRPTDRERMTQIMFETFSVPACHVRQHPGRPCSPSMPLTVPLDAYLTLAMVSPTLSPSMKATLFSCCCSPYSSLCCQSMATAMELLSYCSSETDSLERNYALMAADVGLSMGLCGTDGTYYRPV